MIRALIVDDEPMHIQGMVRHVKWQKLGYDQPLTAMSGQLALELLEKQSVDVLISDVSMPIMNGIELVAQAKKKLPQLQALMISGYDEFEFVQEAIDVGAQGYVLKPLKMEEIEAKLISMGDTIKKLRDIETETKKLQKKVLESLDVVRERFIHDLLSGEAISHDAMQAWSDLLQLPALKQGIRMLLFKYDHRDAQHVDAHSRIVRSSGLLKAVQICLQDMTNMIVAKLGADEVIAIHINPQLAQLVQVEKQCLLVQQMIREQFGSSVTIGFSLIFKTWQEAALRYKKMTFMLAHDRAAGGDQLLYEDRMNEREFQDYRVREEYMPQIIALIEQASDRKEVVDYVAHVCDLLRAERSFSYIQAFAIGLISELTRFKKQQGDEKSEASVAVWQRLIDCQHANEIRDIMLSYIEELLQSREVQQKDQQHHLVGKMIDCLQHRLHEQITLKQIAESFQMNASYLSVLFKKETGKTVSEFLQELRIKKAKQLLKDPQIRIYEVAEQVGFQTSAYFTYLFKKHTGKTPQEYRDYH